MTNEEIKQLISATVRETMEQLRTTTTTLADPQEPPSGLSSYAKTEELLRNYTALKTSDSPKGRRIAEQIETCLEEAANDPYIDVIRLFYFGGVKNAACAKIMCCDERNLRKARRALVKRFAARLATDEFIRELLS